MEGWRRKKRRKTKSELIGFTTIWEYYFNRLRPNFHQKNRSSHQWMKQAGIKSKTAENACLWTVTILDDKNYKHFDFNLPQGGDKVCKFDESNNFEPLSCLCVQSKFNASLCRKFLII